MKNVLLITLFLCCKGWNALAQKQEVFMVDGKAVRGYDVVAFFKASKPVLGVDSLSYTYKDARWLFSSRENLEAFKADPPQYIPQYGGYCAYGTAAGHKVPTDIETWTIVNDKLYFNYNTKVKGSWLKKRDTLISQANRQWPMVKDQK